MIEFVPPFLCLLGFLLVIFDGWKGGSNNPAISLFASTYAIIPAIAYRSLHTVGMESTFLSYPVLSMLWVMIAAIGLTKFKLLVLASKYFATGGRGDPTHH